MEQDLKKYKTFIWSVSHYFYVCQLCLPQYVSPCLLFCAWAKESFIFHRNGVKTPFQACNHGLAQESKPRELPGSPVFKT